MAEYEMQEFTLSDDPARPVLFPRIRLQGCIGLERIAGEMADGTTFTASEVEAIVGEVARRMARHMAYGNSVKIEGLGTFTPSLGLRDGKERESVEEGATRRNAASIHVRDVKFRADKRLVQDTDRQCRLERSASKFRRSSDRYTPRQRLELAVGHIEANGFLSVGDYCTLTGLLRNSAARELRQWAGDPESGITVRGLGTHKVYVRRPATRL